MLLSVLNMIVYLIFKYLPSMSWWWWWRQRWWWFSINIKWINNWVTLLPVCCEYNSEICRWKCFNVCSSLAELFFLYIVIEVLFIGSFLKFVQFFTALIGFAYETCVFYDWVFSFCRVYSFSFLVTWIKIKLVALQIRKMKSQKILRLTQPLHFVQKHWARFSGSIYFLLMLIKSFKY